LLSGPNTALWTYPGCLSCITDGMPSTQLSVLYDTDGLATQSTLSTGTAVTWSLTVQDDVLLNLATYQVSYTP
jgi:hypothetical protein